MDNDMESLCAVARRYGASLAGYSVNRRTVDALEDKSRFSSVLSSMAVRYAPICGDLRRMVERGA